MEQSIKQVRNNFRKGTMRCLLNLGTKPNGYYSTQSLLARELGIPITSLNYHITKMKGEGLISPQNQPIILTEKGIKVFKYIWDNCDKTQARCHNVQIVFEVLKGKLDNPNYIYEPITNKKYKGLKTKLSGFTFMYYGKKVVVVCPDIYADTDEEISSEIQLMVKDIKSILENDFNLTINFVKIARIQRMHIAVLNSNIAKAYKLTGFTEENSEFAIDNSHNVPEVELTNSATALENIMALIKFDGEYNGRNRDNKAKGTNL